MRRIIVFLTLLIVISLSACARPDKGTSPFATLAKPQGEKTALPVGPVQGPDFQILPDALLVYGQGSSELSIPKVISDNSRLASYTEEVDEVMLTGVEIVKKVSREYSVSPRLLLALLDYRSGWVRGMAIEGSLEYPITSADPFRTGLFRQLSWVANELNRGFYSRRVGGLKEFSLYDGTLVHVLPVINDASAALQYVLGKIMGFQDWQTAVGPLGVYASYLSLFGDPLKALDAPYFPADLAQPEMRLPFEPAQAWFFTSGPHSAWGDGAGWAALDFAPDEEKYGCYDSQSWVTAAADGLVVRSADGQVIQDLDSDGDEGTGWTILYMHIAGADRVEAGTKLQAGERIGHPSCEGGPSNGTHLHLALRYNGEWIPADQNIPFVLSGWVSKGDGVEYDGSLIRGGIEIYASGFPTDENKITP
ncbi:MAG: M23 family metallopeptidase [Pelolinea sp.]|nr:M23 family metallopeptidase [Pelolinea sp.]